MKIILVLSFILTLSSSFAEPTSAEEAAARAWDFQNNPFRIDENFESKLVRLPLSGDMSQKGLGWPGYHWALNKGMISQRWTAKKPNHFKYKSPSLEQIKGMSQEQIDELSPAEKFDIFMGNYEYPTIKRVRKQSSPGSAFWTGICHGISPAGLHHPEPKATSVKNSDGVTINFYSSDLKGLLGYYYAKVSDMGITQIGRRCKRGRRISFKSRKPCRDVNPGSFHIIMTNRLGITNDGFIADIDGGKQVWNHVAVKFKSRILARTDKSAVVESDVYYTGTVKPSKTAMIGTDKETFTVKNYKYALDLSNGRITGGRWISKELPDFLWVHDKEKFEDIYYGKILDLL